jgi:CRISPR-associated protein Cmr1
MIAQKKLTVTLETVTPMFLAGANQQKPELRAPSFMGALRYWTRAALGGVLGDNKLEALKKAEEEVWGSTNGTGAVRIQLITKPFDAEHLKALPHKPESEPASRTKFYAVPPGTKFQLVFRQNTQTDETWEMAICSLLMMLAHGGVGRRSRRGWGTTWIVGARLTQAKLPQILSGLIALPAQKHKSGTLTPEMWEAYRTRIIEKALENAQQLCAALKLPLHATAKYPTKYPILSLQDREMPTIVFNSKTGFFNDPIQAIEYFGNQEHQFRPGQEFGSANPRWASPLWVRVLPVSSPQKGYILAMTTLKSEGHRNQANYKRVDQFVESWK